MFRFEIFIFTFIHYNDWIYVTIRSDMRVLKMYPRNADKKHAKKPQVLIFKGNPESLSRRNLKNPD